jgi:hypothetical protein
MFKIFPLARSFVRYDKTLNGKKLSINIDKLRGFQFQAKDRLKTTQDEQFLEILILQKSWAVQQQVAIPGWLC